MPKNARLTGIKALRCYRVEEAAEVSGVSPRTIRNWITDGLPVLDGERPLLIRGDDLQDYIKGTRASRKVRTALDEFYCLACRKARKPAGGFADCTVKGRARDARLPCARFAKLWSTSRCPSPESPKSNGFWTSRPRRIRCPTPPRKRKRESTLRRRTGAPVFFHFTTPPPGRVSST